VRGGLCQRIARVHQDFRPHPAAEQHCARARPPSVSAGARLRLRSRSPGSRRRGTQSHRESLFVDHNPSTDAAPRRSRFRAPMAPRRCFPGGADATGAAD
jgi:hypothetical protein